MFETRVVEKFKTHILYPITFFENRVIYEIMWKNIVEPDRPQMTIWRMRISRCIPKATDTHSEYARLIAFPLYQWLHERTSSLHYTYISCLFSPKINLTLFNRRVSNCRLQANRQPSLFAEVFLTQDRARFLNCWQIIFECIPSFLVINVGCPHIL